MKIMGNMDANCRRGSGRVGAHAALLAIIVGLTFGGAGCDRSGSGRGKAGNGDIRNVILISLDTLRADHLGCYGHSRFRTPAIDKLATEGVLFENYVSTAPSTLASHTALMTGSFPHTHGVPRNGFYVSDKNVTLAEVLKEHGFTTAAFIGSFALASIYNLDQGFDVYDERLDMTRRRSASHERLAEDVTDAVLAWLPDHRDDRLFLFVHYFDAHSSYTPPPPYDRMYRTDSLPIEGSQKDIKAAREKLKKSGNRAISEVGVLNALYGGEISYLDEHLGRLFEGLRKSGVWDNSLVILTGDHGETMVEHREWFDHGRQVYDTTIKPPLIVRFPKAKSGGRRVTNVVSSVDVMPTVLDWLGITGPERMEGATFAAVRNGENLAKHGPVFCEATKPFYKRYENDPTWRNQKKMKCIRTERWKLAWLPLENTYELYDLAADSTEQINLLARPDFDPPPLVEELKRKLHAWAGQANPLWTEKVSSELSTKMLRDMGYVQ